MFHPTVRDRASMWHSSVGYGRYAEMSRSSGRRKMVVYGLCGWKLEMALQQTGHIIMCIILASKTYIIYDFKIQFNIP